MDIFYTLNGYRLKENKNITEAMEDYLEMIYRLSNSTNYIHIKDVASSLNVKASSVSKMMNKLKKEGLIDFEKYGVIHLTNSGNDIGKYLYNRHQTLVDFFKIINGNEYTLEQVEKIEHFIDNITIKNIELFLRNL